MLVRELIDRLQELPEDAEVYASVCTSHDAFGRPVAASAYEFPIAEARLEIPPGGDGRVIVHIDQEYGGTGRRRSMLRPTGTRPV